MLININIKNIFNINVEKKCINKYIYINTTQLYIYTISIYDLINFFLI